MKGGFCLFDDLDEEYVSFERHKNVSCISHLHTCFEIVCVTKGKVDVVANGENFCICAGQAMIIMPLDVHNYEYKSDSECMICVFSRNFAESFCEKISRCRPEKPIVDLEESTFLYVDKKFPDVGCDDRLKAQSVLLPLCEEIYKKCSFASHSESENSLFLKVVDYTSENFLEISGISDVARALRANSSYLSRTFKNISGNDYTHYLNGLKCSYAARLLGRKYPELNISQIAFASGFGTIRSFNRVFSCEFGMTPKEYLKQKKLLSV